jgi:hypothetical protein
MHRWCGSSEVLPRSYITAILLAMLMFAGSALANDRGEYEVKAAFLVNFTHFVEWPDTGSAGPFNLCVVGPDPFGAVLDRVIGNRTVNGRPIAVKRLAPAASDGSCQIAFLNDLDRAALLRLLPLLEKNHALTVGDSLEFAERYGVIGFTVENQRVSLAVHPGHAARCGLKINSQLMRVARIVSDSGRPLE